jgi:DNA-binding MarR family transcriptional regulator
LHKLLKDIPEDILTAYIDISIIQSLEKGKLSEEAILYELLNQLNKSLEKKGKTIEKIQIMVNKLLANIKNHDYDFKDAGTILSIPIPQVNDNYQKLSQFVMEFPQKLVDSSKGKIKGVVIVIDEFQFIGELEAAEAFFWLIRGFNQSQDNVSYIFTGLTSTTSEMVEKLNGMTGAFGNRILQFNIDPFTEKTTKKYLKEKIKDIRFTENGYKRFYNCTKGYPAYINSFCSVMSEKTTYGEEKVVEEFYNKLDQIAVKWIFIWSGLTKQEKEIITTLVENKTLQWKELLEKIDYSHGTLAKNLNKLKNKGLINNLNSNYSIEDNMLETWLKNRKNEDSVYPV